MSYRLPYALPLAPIFSELLTAGCFCSQPDLVYDETRKTVVLVFNHHRTGDWPRGGVNMTTKSTDRGASWSTPAALPLALGLDRAETGPGRALQLSRPPHAGRLLFVT